MTWFARERNSGESVRPICFAAFKLITNSNLVACCTGKSPGFAPFKFLSVSFHLSAVLLQPFFLQPLLLFRFNFLIVLRKGFPANVGLSWGRNLVTEALHLAVIKTVQDLVREPCQPGGIHFPSSGGSRCRRETGRTPIARPIARPCNLGALFLIAIRERLRVL